MYHFFSRSQKLPHPKQPHRTTTSFFDTPKSQSINERPINQSINQRSESPLVYVCVGSTRHNHNNNSLVATTHAPHWTRPHTQPRYIYIRYIYIYHTNFLQEHKKPLSPIHNTLNDPNTHTLFVRVVSHKNERHTPLSLSTHTQLRTAYCVPCGGRAGETVGTAVWMTRHVRARLRLSIRQRETTNTNQKTTTQQQHKVYLNHNQLYI